MIYIVLGMHKSGTTLVAEMLHKSGINMGDFDPSVEYDAGNKYERSETKEVNEAILSCKTDFSLNVITPTDTHALSGNYAEKIRRLIKVQYSIHKNWGFKDPRTCLTYEAWRPHLPGHRLIFVYRHPFEVWSHYTKKVFLLHMIKRSKAAWKAITAWHIYNRYALNSIETLDIEPILINYNKLMEDDSELKRLESFLGTELYDCRKQKLYRSRSGNKQLYSLTVWMQAFFLMRDVHNLFKQIEKRRINSLGSWRRVK